MVNPVSHTCNTGCLENHNEIGIPVIHLAPCPFCNSQPDWDGADSILCDGCGARMPAGYDDFETAKNWNRRHHDANVCRNSRGG